MSEPATSKGQIGESGSAKPFVEKQRDESNPPNNRILEMSPTRGPAMASIMFPKRISGEGYRQLCFDPADLSDAEFNVTAFVSKLRTHAPLTIIRDDLMAHLTELKGELIQGIQRDFNAFVSLGNLVNETEDLVATVVNPLEKVQEDIQTLNDALSRHIQQLDETLALRREMASRQSALELLLRAGELVHRCERLVGEVDSTQNPDEQWLLIERLAGDWAHLRNARDRCPKNSKFIVSLRKKIVYVESNMRRRLDEWLRKGLLSNSLGQTTSVLATYFLTELFGDARACFREVVVLPFVNSSIRMALALATAEKMRGSGGANAAEALGVTEKAIHEFMNSRCSDILDICSKDDRLRKFDLLCTVIWPTIESSIVQNMKAVFQPGIPDVFHRAFLSGSRIFGIMKENCKSSEELLRLKNHSSSIDFWKQWNLPVYFQLRFREIVDPFENPLAFLPQEVAEDDPAHDFSPKHFQLLSPNAYSMIQSRALILAIRKCWDSENYLLPLTHRFLRLNLQLISRYASWAREGVAGKWGVKRKLAVGAAHVFGDLLVMKSRLPAEIAALLRTRSQTNTLGSYMLGCIDSSIAESMTEIANLFPVLHDAMASELSDECASALQSIKGILATYRGYNRPTPTQYSRYVPNILRPLRTFLSENCARLSDDVRLEISRRVIEVTTERYAEVAIDSINNAKKAEDALKRLNIIGKSSASTASESDKISTQLYLDVQKFGTEIELFGLATAEISGYPALWKRLTEETSLAHSPSLHRSAVSTSPVAPSEPAEPNGTERPMPEATLPSNSSSCQQ
uniref:Conserved oligomeric Golgi complex subunit 2 n=1 Tax=Compsopogon caeruleus TaxID=31354 RepID=A0A6T6C4W6_9RHOD|mmetsp:Transcript_3893/g.7446  ORF Transcript_3893/g.7446 Transcript_3893/m.7446 type:complete len:801 (+) Transcript_3893:56-2458(+)